MIRAKTIIFIFIVSVLKLYGITSDTIVVTEDNLPVLRESAMNYANQGNFAQAIRIEQEIVNYFQAIPLCPDYIFSLNNLAAFYSDSGEFEKALELGCKVIELMNDTIKIDLNGQYEIYQHQAIYYENIGNHEKSQEYGQIAKEIAKEMPLTTWAYPRSLVFLAFSYSELGDYDKAIKLALEAKDMYETNAEEKPDDYGFVYNDLGAYYCEKGDIDKALDYGWAYVNYLKNINTKDKQKIVIALNNLARYYAINKNSKKAVELSLEAWSVIEENNISNAYLKGRTLEHLSTFNANMDEYDKAMEYCEQSISYFKEIWKNDRPGIINEYRRHLYYSLCTSCLKNYEQEIIEVGDNITNTVLAAFSFLPNSGRHMYWTHYSDWYEKELPKYVYTLQTDSLVANGYNSVLLSKGILLNSEVEIKQLIESSNDSVLLHRFWDLQKLYLTMLNSNEFVLNDSVRSYLAEEESYLISSCKTFGDYTKQLRVHWRDIQKQLLDDEVAIEFSKCELENGHDVYIAYSLKNDYPVPHYYKICDEDELKESNTNIYELIWKPLEKELQGVNSIYFSPDGELYKTAIESAYCSNEETMVDKYRMYRLSSTRELVKNRSLRTIRKTALFGGLDYDNVPFVNGLTIDIKNNISSQIHINSSTRSIIDSDRSIVGQLDGTKKEIQLIYRLLPKSYIIEVDSSQYGTEEAFKTLSGSQINLLHISTHGYYWPKFKYNAKPPLQIRQNAFTLEDESLARSGLYLAGANVFQKRKELLLYYEDGIATASEIAKLDFRDLDLVVLSACETGLGDIEGDGVFGLQRGFKKAGTNSILMSLWKVNDYTTQLLMVEFYKWYLSGVSKQESLRRAQNYVRNLTDEDGNKVFSAPYYWASFILLDGLN